MADRRLPVVRETALDRVVSYLSPSLGLRRLEARTRLALASSLVAGGYNGGGTGRKSLQEYSPAGRSADADYLPQQHTLRSRSRDLARNAPVAAGGLGTAVTSVVGTGLRPQSQIDRDLLGLTDAEADAWQAQAERIWWAAYRTLDVEGELNAGGLQALAFRAVLESGDVLAIARLQPRRGDLLATRIQLVESDRVCNPRGRLDDARITAGVEADADGRVLAYHVADVHPGEYWRHPTQWSRVAARGQRSGVRLAKLLFEKRRPGQRRGVPYLAPVIEPLKQLTRLAEAELDAAVVSSLFAVFIRTPDGDDTLASAPPGEDAPSIEGDVHLNPGAVISLATGEEVDFAKPERPSGAFDPFFRAILVQIGMALEIPYEVLLKQFQSSYSAARAALLEAWRFFRVRREWLAEEFCQWMYELVIDEAVARGLLDAPGFFDDPLLRDAWLTANWTGDAPGQVDPKKEAEASILLVNAGFSSIQTETARITGQDWEAVHRQRVKEERLRSEAGLSGPVVADDAPEDLDEEAAA